MALIKCKQCGKLISDKATKCPKCGCATNKDLTNYQVDEDRVLAEEPVNYEEDSGSNTKKYLLIALLVAAIVGGGYWWYSQSGDKQEALQFVEQFAKAIEADDRQTVCQLYPNAEKAEAFAISFNKDSIVVSHQNGNDTIDVRLSYKQSLRIVKDDNGQMHVVSSKGLFSYPADQINFAMKTGWINPSLDDVECAERLNEKDFVSWIEKKAIAAMQSKVKVIQSSVKRGENVGSWGNQSADVYNYEVVLENMNSCDIAADAYIVGVVVKGYDFTWWADEGETKSPYSESGNSLTGKMIPRKGTVTYSWVGEEYGGAHGGRVPEKLECNVIFNPSKEVAIAAYEPTGKEFSEYLNSKVKR
jgi:hypothetical protein